MVTRLPRRKGVPMWIPTRTVDINGENIQLYKVYINNKPYERTKAQIESQISEEELIASFEVSEYMKKQLRRASIREFGMSDAERLAKFLGKMPAVVAGMLAVEQNGAKLPPGFKRRLNLIQQKLESLPAEDRERFYYENRELFEDTTDWYRLTKKYAHKPGEIFSLDEKDIQRLEEMGFSSLRRENFRSLNEYSTALYNDYINKVYNDLGEINNTLNDFINKRRR